MPKEKQNTEPRRTKQDITTQIIREFKDQSRAEIKKWRDALRIATNVDNPRQYLLQDLYDNLESDGHFLAQVGLRKAATMGYGFSIIDRKTGETNNEKTKLFQSEWFYDLMENLLDVPLKGYTVLELINPNTMEFSLLPRRNVSAQRQMAYFEVMGEKGVDLTSPEYAHTLIRVGKAEDLGIMAHLCGQLIWKRNAQQSWAEFTERFGMPLISATTNKTSKADIDKINSMLRTLGEAATAVLPEGTSIKIDPFTGGDSYKVYDAQIERINEEMSKPITGGTMITDDGSSRSQAQVHERNLDDKIAESDRRMVQFTVNNQLIPIMQYWGWDINPDTDEFQFDPSFELTLAQHWNIVNQALVYYDMDEEWLAKTFSMKIIGRRKTPEPIPPQEDTDDPEQDPEDENTDKPKKEGKPKKGISASFR